MTIRCNIAGLLACVIVLLTNQVSNASFSINVKSGEEECIAVRPPKEQRAFINGNFDCLDDNIPPDPIAVTLYKEEGMITAWKSVPGASEGTFAMLATGRHLLCIRNGPDSGDDMSPMGDGLDRRVGFSIRVVPLQRGRNTEEAGPDDEKTAKLIELTNVLTEGLETMMDHQAYLRNREAVHRDLTEMTFQRVVRWTILEAVVLVAVAGGQVIYLRKFFEQRRYL
mmetsp:Transcript_52634/g.63371  ORF Transcript_52634/g.63371 Transcript_52634/m.63371 type:complete len:225 (-) Transcript_52634:138-812(-)